MRPRRYYHYVNRKSSRRWKVLHVVFFVLICLSALASAEAICDIFDIFNYRCVLYAKASIKFIVTDYKNKTTEAPTTNKFDLANTNQNASLLLEMEVEDYLQLNLGIDNRDYEKEMYGDKMFFDINQAEKVPGTKDIYVMNEELWVDNETLTGRAHLGMTSSIFTSLVLCDFVVLVPFMSIIISIFFILVILMFSRADRGSLYSVPPAYLYVYPLVISASVMTVTSIIASDLFINGIHEFCTDFVNLTGQIKCSPMMDYFTKEQRRGYRHFFVHVLIGRRGFVLTSLFWICQLAVGLLRLFSVADYNLTSVLITSKHDRDNISEEAFLMQWEDSPVPQLAVMVDTIQQENKDV